MLGMLTVGIALNNIPLIKDKTRVDSTLSSNLKTVSLMVILIKGGLSLDIMDIKRVGFAVIRLAFLPCFVEGGCFAVLAVFLLGLPWVWAFMLGFVIAAVTPAIIVPVLMDLKKRFKVEENNITTMLISASSFDDVVAISAYMIFHSSAFSSGSSMVRQILQGPLEILVGVVVGVVVGVGLWFVPSDQDQARGGVRACLLLSLGLSSVFGMSYLGFSGSGPLSVIVMSLTAGKRWGEDQVVCGVVDWAWFFCEPLLFGLVGRDIQFEFITGEILWKTLVIITVALAFRLLTAFLSVSRTGLSLREKIFVAFCWIPKATVQAAIGSYALSVAQELGVGGITVTYARIIVTVAVLVILISAPLGALLMSFSAPLLLQKKEKLESENSEEKDEEVELNI